MSRVAGINQLVQHAATASNPGSNNGSHYESTSNKLEISSDESLSSNEEESFSTILVVFNKLISWWYGKIG